MRNPMIVLALLAVAACNRGEQQAKVVTSDGGNSSTVTVPSENGALQVTTGTAAKMPAGFPAYPGAEQGNAVATMAAAGMSGSGSGGMASFLTSDPPEKVVAFYRTAAERLGYKLGMNADMGGTHMLGGSREGADGGGFQLIVQRDGASGKTAVTLMAGSGS